jgi:Undecaprenyl-phosphate glucose phosphotransferase
MSNVATSDYGIDDVPELPPRPAQEHARWSRKVAIDLIAFGDTLCCLGGSALATVWYLHSANFSGGNGIAALELALMSAAVGHFVLRQLGQYDEARIPAVSIHLTELALALFLVFATVQSVSFTLGAAQAFPRGWQPLSLVLGGGLLLGMRLIVRRFLAPLAKAGMFDANLAIYGAGEVARAVVSHVERGGSGLHLSGIFDDRANSVRLDGDGLSITGGLADLIEAGRADRIDEIIIALPQSAGKRIADIARKLEHLPVRIRICTHIASDLVDAQLASHKVSSVGPVGLLDVKSKPLIDWAPFVKRLEDIVIGVPALICFAPVMLLIALAIKLDSPGPVFFRQKRHGLNHRVIEVLKFRSMRVAEDGPVVTQATRHDPRVTRVGRFIRRTSLDELPQLINIVAGDMSLVGPRPHALVHNEHYGEMLERYANRHQVKPGLTGWAQVNGYRGETQTNEDMRKRVEYDLVYITNWSLLMDLRILAATPIYGFTGKNAF